MKVNVREDKRCARQPDVASGRGELKTCKHGYLMGGGVGMTLAQ